ncbi:hypothetical protein MVUOKPPV_CDS0296 [Klebsiella phage phi1_175008]|uniref:Uncharacterized protein n=2 Tax=Klebsiella phage phi1_175008 TaxID=3127744 RepID=A0ACD5FRX1_9CAUD
MFDISLDKLAEAIEKAGDAKYGSQDHYFIGQYPDGSYYGVLSTKVKSRSSAAQLRTPEFFEQKGIKAIKVMKRGCK